MLTKDRNTMEQMKIFAEEYARDHNGNTPSTAVFGKQFGMTRQSAFRYLKAMSKEGMIYYQDGEITTPYIGRIRSQGPRGYAFTEDTVTAGAYNIDETNADDIFSIPPVFVEGKYEKYYVLSVQGDSMKDAGVEPGDAVLVRVCQTAKEGDIVAAYIRGEGSVLKRYMTDEEGPYLWAENKKWNDEERMFGREFEI